MSIKEFVKEAIAAETVVIFSKSYCPFSQMAKEVFEKLNHTYKVVELDGSEVYSGEIQDVLAQMTGARSLPRVFIKGECIGGGTDCEAMFISGELPRKLHHIMFNIPCKSQRYIII
ncbi:hypothetical protein HCN44_006735 [Aphidius gifuensis]|uniref:Glutaredoxin domain-containing protein n=1 Tax=Aphidius gifuensis TaxID=684658 RepID=A0A835CVR2_APHGI|nr:hypothetical protein HCN44_006735 [Aphidius gifuensis]